MRSWTAYISSHLSVQLTRTHFFSSDVTTLYIKDVLLIVKTLHLVDYSGVNKKFNVVRTQRNYLQKFTVTCK